MKKVFMAMALIFSLSATAQKSEVFIDSSQSKGAILSKAVQWMTKIWGDQDKVVNAEDDTNAAILFRGGLKAAPKTDGFAVKGLTTTEISIVINDGKAKLDFARTTFKWDAGTLWNFEDDNGGTQKAKWKADTLNEIDELIAGFKAALK